MPLDHLPLDAAILIALITQAVLYGIFFVLVIGTIYVIAYGKSADRINWPLLLTAIAMLVLITMNLGFSSSRVMEAFITLQPELRTNPNVIIEYFENLRHWKEVTRTALYIVLTAIADSLFIYRLYIVWGRNKYIVIGPIFLLCGSLTAGIGIEVEFAATSDGIFAKNVASWVTSFFCISLAQNVITTCLIVYRIWRVNMQTSKTLGASSLWPVVVIILESGAIYSSTLLLLLVTYLSNSQSQYIAVDMLVPVIGITFSLIIVRIGLGVSSGGTQKMGSSVRPGDSLPLQRLNIAVQKHVTVDNDLGHVQSMSSIKEDGDGTVGTYTFTQWEQSRRTQ